MIGNQTLGDQAIYTIAWHLHGSTLRIATTTMVHVRVDEHMKAQATETLAAMAEADTITHTRHARFATAAELFDDLEKNSGK